MDFINCMIIFIFIYILSIGINNIIDYAETIHNIEKNEFKNELTNIIKETITDVLNLEKKIN